MCACSTQMTVMAGLRVSLCCLQKPGNPLQAAVEEIWEIGQPWAQHTAVHAKLAAVFSCISTGARAPSALSLLPSLSPARQSSLHIPCMWHPRLRTPWGARSMDLSPVKAGDSTEEPTMAWLQGAGARLCQRMTWRA